MKLIWENKMLHFFLTRLTENSYKISILEDKLNIKNSINKIQINREKQ